MKEKKKKKYKLLKEKLKAVVFIHRPQEWGGSSGLFVCDNCKVPYPCVTLRAIGISSNNLDIGLD